VLSRLVLPTFAMLAFAAPSQAADYYVAQGGIGGSCTSAQPCAAIATAVGVASNDDTVHIGPGTYPATVDTVKRLTFIGAGAGSATSTNPATDTFIDIPGDGSAAAMTLRGGGRVSTLRLRGQHPSGASVGGHGLLLMPNGGADGLAYAVDGVVATGGLGIQDGEGIAVSGATAPSRVFSVAISASTLRSRHDAVYLSAANANVSVQDSELHGAMEAWVVGTARVDRVHGDGAAVIWHGNLVIDRSRFETSPGSALAVIGYGGTARATVRDSVFASASNSALQPGTPIGAGVVQGGDNAGDDAVLTSVGSTFYATGSQWNAALLGIRVQTRLGNVGIHLVDTILRRQGADAVTTSDLLATTPNSPGGAVTVDASHSGFSSSRVSGLSTAPAAGSATNVAGDPLFVSAPVGTLAGADLALQPGSPLVDAGDPAAVTAGELDFAGAARVLDGNGDCSALPDIGAYERPAVACPESVATPPPAPLPVDGVKPVLSKLKVAKGRANFSLSEAARVTLVVERATRGRRAGKRCVTTRRSGKRCTKWVRVRRLTLAGKAGTNAIKLGKLRHGGYRVRASAVDAGGNASATATRRFST
jgi:hypothetical protein